MRKPIQVPAVCAVVVMALGVGAHAAPAATTTPKHCVGAEEARVRAAGQDEGPPKFTPAFFRRLLVLDVSLDGADGTQLPISIEQVCNIPKRLRKQAAALAGGDGVALLLPRTTVWQDGQQATGDDIAAAIDGADTAYLRVRLKQRGAWSEDEDGNPVPTFRTGRIEITD
jgi:hypothetical protein